MSPEDARQEKGNVLLEYEEVKAEMAVLESKLQRIASSIEKFASLIRHHPEHLMRAGQTYSGVAVIAGPVDEQMVETVRDVDEVFKTSSTLRSAKMRLDDLARRKQALGLS